ncbi:MAG: exo-alpha-sialidase [Pirellulales bacterium]|nr:exo-alpha-sialidase [Pirellulales bacterium]
MFFGFSRSAFADDKAESKFIHVCRNVGGREYHAFPDVCRLKDGRLMVVFYSGYRHASLPNEKWPKGGQINCCASSDEGHSWSAPEMLYDGPYDDRDPSIAQLKDGRLICNFFCVKKPDKPRGYNDVLGTWLISSDDLGKTWSKPRKPYDDAGDIYVCSTPLRELSDGRLILPLYTFSPLDPLGAMGAIGVSDDGGKTWRRPIHIDNDGRELSAETDLIELKDRTLYAAERSERGSMCFSVSKDRGENWSVSRPIGFKGHCPYLHRTTDGIIILGYRQIFASSTCLRYSLDECETWSDEVLVDKKLGAYPSMVNLKDGSVLIVYYEESEPLGGSVSAIRAKRFRAAPDGVEWLVP